MCFSDRLPAGPGLQCLDTPNPAATQFIRESASSIELRPIAGDNAGMDTMDEQLVGILRRQPGIRLAILFGSRATGDAGPDSDIDLGLLMDTPLSSDFTLKLAGEIGQHSGCPVDIVDLYEGPQPILGQVLRGRKLLGDNRSHAELLKRHLFDSADFLPLRRRILEERQARWTR